MEILKRIDLLDMPEKSEVSGYVLVQSYQTMPQKNGGQYISGHLQALGDIPFKVWSDTSATSLYAQMISSQDFAGKVMRVTGKVDRFGGSLSLVLSSGTIVDEDVGVTPTDLMENVYDAEKYYQTLTATLNKYCSPKAMMVFELVMKKYKNSFIKEFGAIHHHDNCKSGLLAHTTKVTKLATMIKIYPSLFDRVSTDLLFLGCALHDLGKISEYNNGAISEEGKSISHMISGPLMLSEFKEEIEKLMGSDFYIGLISILGTHAGEFGEPPRTVVAYVIHLMDCLEANLTSLNQLCADNQGQFKYLNYTFI